MQANFQGETFPSREIHIPTLTAEWIKHWIKYFQNIVKNFKFCYYLPYDINDYFPILSLSLWNALSTKKQKQIVNQKSDI